MRAPTRRRYSASQVGLPNRSEPDSSAMPCASFAPNMTTIASGASSATIKIGLDDAGAVGQVDERLADDLHHRIAPDRHLKRIVRGRCPSRSCGRRRCGRGRCGRSRCGAGGLRGHRGGRGLQGHGGGRRCRGRRCPRRTCGPPVGRLLSDRGLDQASGPVEVRAVRDFVEHGGHVHQCISAWPHRLALRRVQQGIGVEKRGERQGEHCHHDRPPWTCRRQGLCRVSCRTGVTVGVGGDQVHQNWK